MEQVSGRRGEATDPDAEQSHASTADIPLLLRRRRPPPANTSASSTLPEEAAYSGRASSSDSGDESSVDANSGEGELSLTDQIGGAKKAEANGEEESIGTGHMGAEADSLLFAYRPSAPAHRRVKESPLSSDSIFRQSHAGLFNLCVVVLVAVNSRLIIENLMKYGLLISTEFWFSSKSLREWPLLMCCLMLPIFPLCSYTVEKLAQLKVLSKLIVILLHVIITTTAVLFPIFVILRFDSAVLSGIHLMLLACIVWLKLVSYAHVNYDMRTSCDAKDKVDISSHVNLDNSYNVRFKSLAYFMVAPTLCYQPVYPRTTCIRKGWVMRQTVKLVIFTGLMGFIIEQYINPIVKNSQHPLKGNFLYAIERILKLSVPTLYFWLCMFYCFFHLWCNILAELLRFGDREFYKDWWNARTVDEYWRMWNMPVHKWMVRHIYFPCLRNGLPKSVAIGIAFFVSAVFHELCIGVPCHIFKFWAFIGIMFQVPLVILTSYLRKKFRSDMVGNMIFWSFFSIFGQPMCILLYYHDVMNRKVRAE